MDVCMYYDIISPYPFLFLFSILIFLGGFVLLEFCNASTPMTQPRDRFGVVTWAPFPRRLLTRRPTSLPLHRTALPTDSFCLSLLLLFIFFSPLSCCALLACVLFSSLSLVPLSLLGLSSFLPYSTPFESTSPFHPPKGWFPVVCPPTLTLLSPDG